MWSWTPEDKFHHPHRSYQFHSWSIDTHFPCSTTWVNRKIITMQGNYIFLYKVSVAVVSLLRYPNRAFVTSYQNRAWWERSCVWANPELLFRAQSRSQSHDPFSQKDRCSGNEIVPCITALNCKSSLAQHIVFSFRSQSRRIEEDPTNHCLFNLHSLICLVCQPSLWEFFLAPPRWPAAYVCFFLVVHDASYLRRTTPPLCFSPQIDK